MFAAVVALEEVLLVGRASGGGVELVVVAVLELAHEEVAGVDLAVNSDLWVRHIYYYCGESIIQLYLQALVS